MNKRTIPPGELELQLKTRLATLEGQRAAKRAARKTSRGSARVRLAGLTGVLGLLLLSVSGVFAVHDEGFQLDGNATAADLSHGAVCIDDDGDNQTPCVEIPAGNLSGAFAGPYDWDSLFNIQPGAAPGNALGTVTGPKAVLPDGFVAADFQKDFGNTGTTFLTGDNTVFATGSKDELDIPDWQCGQDNNVNSKTDIINGFAALMEDGDEEIIYFGLEKDVDNGSNNVGVWLLQDPEVGCTSAGGNTDFTGEHQVGDILIVSAFTNGGGVSNIDVYQWDPATTDATNPLDLLASSADCLIRAGGDAVCATVFQPDTEGGDDTLQMPWLSADNSVVNAPHQSPNFYEGGINLDAFPQFADRCFTSYLLDTRSSPSTDATLFDYVFGTLGNCAPEIEVTKSPSVDDVCEGADTEVTYTYTVTNTGNVDLTNIDISDDTIPGAQAAFEAANGGSDDLAEGAAAVQFELDATINATTTNVVTVDADSIAGENTAEAEATATVTAHDCTITITKTPDEEDVCAGEDTLITYTYEVTNNSDLFDATVDIWDDAGTPGDATDDVLVADDLAVAAGDTESDTESFTVSATTTNTATATATFDDVDSTTDTATADATVTAHDCTITITKTPSATEVCNGGTVDYDYLVTNNSDFFTWTGDVVDDMGTPGDATDDELLSDDLVLGPGDDEPLELNGVVIDGTVTNTVTATGTFDDPASTSANADADATVEGLECDINITKTPSAEDVCNGSTVDYDYLVDNPSGFDWTGDVVDDMGTPGDATDDELLADNVTILAGDDLALELNDVAITGAVTNTVTATGAFNDPASTSANASAEATVTGHICTITVTKTPSDTDVCNGSTVDYDYRVTNNSDEFDWTGDVVDDSGTPGVPGDDVVLATGATIAAGAFADYENNGVVITGTVTNIVLADGAFDDPDATAASDTDTATVTGHVCDIDITKTPSATQVCNGDLVDYDYLVTNNSTEFTWTGDVVDDAGTPGDATDDVTLATDLVLAPGASQALELNGVVINGTVTNTVTATGAFDDPASTSANADAEATVVGENCGGGCTPGFWQGGFGKELWDEVDDPDWTDAGGAGTNPFVTTDLFSTGPWGPSGIASIDTKTMLQIVGSGGGNSWARKAARDLVAAYLNASFGLGYPFSTATILADWDAAVDAGTSGFRAFHDKYGPANELGCTIGQTIT